MGLNIKNVLLEIKLRNTSDASKTASQFPKTSQEQEPNCCGKLRQQGFSDVVVVDDAATQYYKYPGRKCPEFTSHFPPICDVRVEILIIL